MIREILRTIVLNKRNKLSKSFKRLPFMSSIKRNFRVGLTDIDFNMHINNSRYMVFMERARWDHPLQTDTWDVMLQEKLNFIVAGIEMGYIREIRFAKKFHIETCYLGWDEKYVYLEQRFIADGKIHAYGLVKGIFLQQGEKTVPENVAKILGINHAQDALPEHMALWKRLAVAKRAFSTPVNIEKKHAA